MVIGLDFSQGLRRYLCRLAYDRLDLLEGPTDIQGDQRPWRDDRSFEYRYRLLLVAKNRLETYGSTRLYQAAPLLVAQQRGSTLDTYGTQRLYQAKLAVRRARMREYS